ncbi:galactose-6-phosphate isomerase [Granulicatella balaenopterae]|uniref:Galactose-6-phosphate isomerase n=1 Tax=Granulicatella balaenopterae TaxID=137733 RepID=A0A1H9J114_9LACT|nr:galactose-6-phosphate isomerase subunit LacA [Granulicatella balaenopterae]SEQ80523.1 galactose-6-phosphate isomerase [Granulicatella balaenopterae]
MKIAIASDCNGFDLKEHIKEYLVSKGYEIVDLSEEPTVDFVDSAASVSKAVLEGEAERGIMFDAFGAPSALASNKIHGMVTANVREERTAHMTTEHNGAKAIAIGAQLVGKGLAESLVDTYLGVEYAAGRHQIRLDMLEKLY